MLVTRKQTSSYQSKVIKELENSSNASTKFWTEFEKDMLRKYYGKKPTRVLAKVLGKTHNAIARQASFLGIPFEK
jgi:transcriptional regulator of aromatic amino acid metabolism